MRLRMKTSQVIRIRRYLFIVSTVFLILSCQKDERQATKSLEGNWKVVTVETIYGSQSEFGFSVDSSFLSTGDLGSFDFSDDHVDYKFIAHNVSFDGNSNWTLEADKVNEGFVRVNQFILTIEDDFVFDVDFGNSTKNSEKNATQAVFNEKTSSGKDFMLYLELEKE